MTRLLALFALSALAASCSMEEEERISLLESAGRTNYAIARGTVVRDMRAPSDTGRLIYEPPVHLSIRTAPAAGAAQMWAPFGIATPDTVPPRARTNR
ncbi:MAG TPA: hypothetical protein VFZ04_06185 [Longimicrobiales bacterium]